MELTNSILRDVRAAVGLDPDANDFDTELLMHVNSAVGRLNQNGVGNVLVITNDQQTWNDLRNPAQTAGNEFFVFVPLFVALSTKLIFDPPPPSTVERYVENIEQSLWRLKLAYEIPYIEEGVDTNE